MTELERTMTEERAEWKSEYDSDTYYEGEREFSVCNALRLIDDVNRYEPIVQAVAKAPCLCRNANEGGRCLGCDAKAALGLPLPDKAHASKSD